MGPITEGTTGQSAHGARRRLRVLGLAGGAILVAACGTVGLLFAEASALARRAAQQALPTLSRQLGFDVRFKGIEASAWPQPSVALSHLVIAKAGESPVLAAGTVRARVALWPLVRSLGTTLRLEAVTLEDAQLGVTRQADGTWDLLVLTEAWLRLQAASSAPLRVDRLTVHATRLDVRDKAAPAPGGMLGAIGAVTAEVDLQAPVQGPSTPHAAASAMTSASTAPQDVAAAALVGAAAHIRSRAAVGSEHPNVTADLVITAASAGVPSPTQGRDVRGSIEAEGLDLAGLRWLIPAALEEVASDGVLSTKLVVTTEAGGIVSAAGPATIERIHLLDQPTTITCAVEAKVHTSDPADPELRLPTVAVDRLSIEKLEVRGLRAQAATVAKTFRAEQGTATFCGAPLSIGQAILAPGAHWNLAGALDGLSLTEFARAASLTLPLSGNLSAQFDTHGAGKSWGAIRSQLSGSGRFEVRDGQLPPSAFTALIAPIQQALSSAGVPPALVSEWVKAPPSVPIEPFGASFRIVDGGVRLVEPVTLRTPQWEVVLTGSVGLDQSLALRGYASPRRLAAALSPSAPGTAPRNSPNHRLPLALGGTLSDPRLEITATPAQIAGLVVNAIPTPREIQEGALRQLGDWLRRR